MRQINVRWFLILFVAIIFTEVWITKTVSESQLSRLNRSTIQNMEYRGQEIGEMMLGYIQGNESPGEEVGLYLLETQFGYRKFPFSYDTVAFLNLREKWQKSDEWRRYKKYTEAIWNDVKYFPVPEFTKDSSLKVTFSDSWMYERNYGGKRGHEGTDIMANQNVAGLYPIVSMTDGIVTNKGWLEKGGYRIGIETPSGAYFYYAHLDSYAAIEIGDEVRAGDILGFMGDTGYGEEGTTGKFPVHLHLGIYIYPEKELSVNPYWILRYVENQRVKSNLFSGDMK